LTALQGFGLFAPVVNKLFNNLLLLKEGFKQLGLMRQRLKILNVASDFANLRKTAAAAGRLLDAPLRGALPDLRAMQECGHPFASADCETHMMLSVAMCPPCRCLLGAELPFGHPDGSSQFHLWQSDTSRSCELREPDLLRLGIDGGWRLDSIGDFFFGSYRQSTLSIVLTKPAFFA
jgi:hypothetical protein